MRIGIDIDDTICYSIENMLPYICEFYGLDYNEEKNKKLGYEAYHYLPNYIEFAKNHYDKFMCDAKMKEKASYYINKLYELGHEIIFITARSEYGFSDAYNTSRDYLEKNNISYDKLIVGAIEKGKVCKEENIDLFIDDNIRNCIDVRNNGVEVWLFYNEFNKDNNDFYRVINWEDAYNKIVNKKNQLDC